MIVSKGAEHEHVLVVARHKHDAALVVDWIAWVERDHHLLGDANRAGTSGCRHCHNALFQHALNTRAFAAERIAAAQLVEYRLHIQTVNYGVRLMGARQFAINERACGKQQ